MTVERLEAKHLPDVAALESLCFSHPWSEHALALLLQDGNFGLAATENGRVVAYVGLTTVLDEGAITNVATHPDCRRKGYARAILRALLCEAEARGICRITLEVRESNDGAKALYESLGFMICGKRRNFYTAPREDGLVLEKIL